MKILMQVSILAIVEVDELPGFAARVNMQTPKVQFNHVFVPHGSVEEIPSPDAAKDYVLIGTAHVLKFLSDGAQEKLKEIGEPVLTQAGGEA